MKLAGVGPTTASALVATVGNGSDFKSSRQFSAWLGLVPGQRSSGGKARLGSITKAGDAYLRTLLILGARSMLMKAAAHSDRQQLWGPRQLRLGCYSPGRLGGMECGPRSGGPACSLARHL